MRGRPKDALLTNRAARDDMPQSTTPSAAVAAAAFVAAFLGHSSPARASTTLATTTRLDPEAPPEVWFVLTAALVAAAFGRRPTRAPTLRPVGGAAVVVALATAQAARALAGMDLFSDEVFYILRARSPGVAWDFQLRFLSNVLPYEAMQLLHLPYRPTFVAIGAALAAMQVVFLARALRRAEVDSPAALAIAALTCVTPGAVYALRAGAGMENAAVAVVLFASLDRIERGRVEPRERASLFALGVAMALVKFAYLSALVPSVALWSYFVHRSSARHALERAAIPCVTGGAVAFVLSEEPSAGFAPMLGVEKLPQNVERMLGFVQTPTWCALAVLVAAGAFGATRTDPASSEGRAVRALGAIGTLASGLALFNVRYYYEGYVHFLGVAVGAGAAALVPRLPRAPYAPAAVACALALVPPRDFSHDDVAADLHFRQDLVALVSSTPAPDVRLVAGCGDERRDADARAELKRRIDRMGGALALSFFVGRDVASLTTCDDAECPQALAFCEGRFTTPR